MSTNALESQGMKIYVGDSGSPEAFAAIPEVKSIGGPDGQAALRDVTDLDSSAKEFEPGLKDEGNVTLSIQYIPQNAVHTTLRSAFSNRTLKSFKIEFTDAGVTQWEFDGYVTGFAVSAAIDETLMASVTIKVTGAVVESA
jgi:hypothetical protein